MHFVWWVFSVWLQQSRTNVYNFSKMNRQREVRCTLSHGRQMYRRMNILIKKQQHQQQNPPYIKLNTKRWEKIQSAHIVHKKTWRCMFSNSPFVPAGSPSRGGDVTVYVWHKPTELAHSFLICSYVYFRLYGSFNCISFHEFSQQISVFWLCSSCLLSSFQLYIFVWKSLSALIWSLVVGWAQNTN